MLCSAQSRVGTKTKDGNVLGNAFFIVLCKDGETEASGGGVTEWVMMDDA